jgi:hypothetical protein
MTTMSLLLLRRNCYGPTLCLLLLLSLQTYLLPSINTASGQLGSPSTARCMASMVACRMLIASIVSLSTTALQKQQQQQQQQHWQKEQHRQHAAKTAGY